MNKTTKPKGSLISYFSRLATVHQGINLAQGVSGFAPPEELLSLLEKYIFDKIHLHQYPPGNGNFRLLELLSAHYSQYYPIQSDQVLIVQGATEGISLVFLYLHSLLKQKYCVLSFDPPYESYAKLAHIYNVPFRFCRYGNDLSIDFNNLEYIIKNQNVKIIFLASPGNPLGKIWSKAELENLNTLSIKYDIFIIYDAVYQDIYFRDKPFNPITFHNPRLFYISAFSKMLSITGWRIGYIISDFVHLNKIKAIHDYTGLCAPTLFQRAIVDYLEKYKFGKSYTQLLRREFKKACNELSAQLEDMGFILPAIQGGYFIWAQLPLPYKDGWKFANELFDMVKVAVVPGENFSSSSKNFIRCNFATGIDTVREASIRMKAFFSSKTNHTNLES